MTRIVFIDTETTSLRPDRRAWEIALIVRDPGKDDVEHSWFVSVDDLDLGNAELASLRIGRFYERHPEANLASHHGSAAAVSEWYALHQVEHLTRGGHLVGAVPNFDADVLGARMRDHNICPSWHYHLIDVETLAVGHLAAQGRRDVPLPWRSQDVSRVLGVEPPTGDQRHTALGDACWARDLYDAVMRP